MKLLWANKYNPTTLDEYIFHDKRFEERIRQSLAESDIPSHLLFSGIQGTGKSSLAKLIIKVVQDSGAVDDSDVMYVNASHDNSVEYIRSSIIPFAETLPLGKFRIVRLEEADRLTGAAQDALRETMITQADTCRFILTCNYENRMIPALKSRVSHIHFKAPPKDEIIVRCGEILTLENIEFDIDLLTKYVTAAYPDIRQAIQLISDNSIDGKLTEATVNVGADYKFELLDLLVANDFKSIRKLICENVAREEFDGVYQFLYQNIHLALKDVEKQESAILIIAKYLDMNRNVADPEICFAACAIDLGRL